MRTDFSEVKSISGFGVLFQNPKSGFQNLNPTLVSVADVFSDVTQRSPFWGPFRDIPKTRKYEHLPDMLLSALEI